MNLHKILLCGVLACFISVGVPFIINSVEAHGNHPHRYERRNKRIYRQDYRRYRYERRRVYRGGAYIYVQPPVIYTPIRRCVARQIQWCHPHYRYERRCY